MLSVPELLALPYGDPVSGAPLSVGELAALSGAGNPFSGGLTLEDFRVQVRRHGERVRWFHAVETALGPGGETQSRGGVTYIEQPLDGDVRVFLYQNSRDVAVEQFGLLARGSTMISFVSEEIDPIRDDRFIAVDRTLTSRQTLTPSGGATDALNHKYAVSVSAMWAPGAKINPTLYGVENGLLTWNGAPPTGEVTLIYRYRPVYEWQGKDAHQAPLGSDAKRLPGSGPLRLLSAGEE